MAESYPNGWKTLGKGEIARCEQFLLFPQCFQKACFPGASKGVVVWEWVERIPGSHIYECQIIDVLKIQRISLTLEEPSHHAVHVNVL